MVRFSLIKAIGAPGSFGFLAFGTAVGLALMFVSPRTRKLGRRMLVALAATYLILSIPVVATLIAGEDAAARAHSASAYGKLDEIFVLDGDNYLARAELTAQIVAASPPRTVWVLGGGELRRALVAYGVPNGMWQWGGGPARTTYDQMLWVQQTMEAGNTHRAAVVASRVQMPRVAGLARRLNLSVVLIPAPLDSEPAVSGVMSWLPSLAGLAVSRDALYEHLAFAYYRWNGWL